MPWPIGLVVKNGSNARAIVASVHALARIGDGDADVLAGCYLGVVRRIGLVKVGVGGLDGERGRPPAWRRGH